MMIIDDHWWSSKFIDDPLIITDIPDYGEACDDNGDSDDICVEVLTPQSGREWNTKRCLTGLSLPNMPPPPSPKYAPGGRLPPPCSQYYAPEQCLQYHGGWCCYTFLQTMMHHWWWAKSRHSHSYAESLNPMPIPSYLCVLKTLGYIRSTVSTLPIYASRVVDSSTTPAVKCS